MIKYYKNKVYTGKHELLAEGEYKGYKFYIKNNECAPLAYIEIPETSKLYQVRYIEYTIDTDLDVHGGVTFTENHLPLVYEESNKWFVGWDYAHAGDYLKLPIKTTRHSLDKKWTFDEILNHIYNAIEQIIEIDKEK